MAKRNSTVSGSTRTSVEKKVKKEKKPKPPRLTQEEKDAKYGNQQLNYKLNFSPLTETQGLYFENMTNDDKVICFGVGSAGSGKSYTAIAAALQLLKNSDKYKKIIDFIPTVESSKSMSLGFLKGDLNEKTQVYKESELAVFEKVLKNCGNENSGEYMKKLFSDGFIQFDLVNFCKGKTYDDSIILVSEAEDFTKSDMLLLLTRIGNNSKFIISGDDLQVSRADIINGQNKSGLIYAIEKLGNMDEVSIDRFEVDDIVRNKIITKILKLWNK